METCGVDRELYLDKGEELLHRARPRSSTYIRMVLESSRASWQVVGARAHILLFLARAFIGLSS